MTADNDALNIASRGSSWPRSTSAAIPVGAIVIESGATSGERGRSRGHDAASAVGIACAGSAPHARSPAATPRTRRSRLRRQAVELSLYAFKYVDEADSVVVFLPPSSEGDSGGLIYLRRDDVRDELKLPLAETLPTRTAQIVGDASTAGARRRRPADRLAPLRLLVRGGAGRQPDPRSCSPG